MKIDGVPQDAAPTYGGHRKLLYAVDEQGHYTEVQSSGWEAESTATLSAIAEIERLQNDAWQRVQTGLSSPLEYYMYWRRMDVALLAQTSGIWQWRVRRHFHPQRFSKLSARVLGRYAEALGLTIAQLREAPSRNRA